MESYDEQGKIMPETLKEKLQKNLGIDLKNIKIDENSNIEIKQEGYSIILQANGTMYKVENDQETNQEIQVAALSQEDPNANYSITNENGKTTYYETLAAANTAAKSGDTIVLEKDVTDETTVNISKNITLDTNKKVLNRNNTEITTDPNINCTFTINGGGTIETDNSNLIANRGEGEIIIEQVALNKKGDNNLPAIMNIGTGNITIDEAEIIAQTDTIQNSGEGKIIIESGTIQSENKMAVSNISEGEITINDGKILSVNHIAIGNSSEGEITINNGEIQSLKNVINNSGTGKIYIKGGKISDIDGNSPTVANANTGTIEISGGEILASKSVAAVNINGTMNIKSGTLTARQNTAIQNTSGTVTIEGGKINGNKSAISNIDTGKIKIKGGKITESSQSNAAINNNVSGTITIEDGTITSEQFVAIYNKGQGTVNINGGTINAKLNIINNIADGDIYINDGTLTGAKSGNYPAINNNEKGSITMNGGKIISEHSLGIQNKGEGTITVNAGTIEAYTNGISNLGTGTINIGSDENETTQNPVITGQIAVNNADTGTFNFYNGELNGTTSEYSGTMTKKTTIKPLE